MKLIYMLQHNTVSRVKGLFDQKLFEPKLIKNVQLIFFFSYKQNTQLTLVGNFLENQAVNSP